MYIYIIESIYASNIVLLLRTYILCIYTKICIYKTNIDITDATANIKSPSKDVKTNKNLQMRLKVQEPVQSLYRTDALSPTWMMGCKKIYYLTNNIVYLIQN